MRILVAVNGEKKWCVGNTVKAFKDFVDTVDGKEFKILTIFYDGKKERRRFKREVRRAGGDVVKAAKNYLSWWETIQKRRAKEA